MNVLKQVSAPLGIPFVGQRKVPDIANIIAGAVVIGFAFGEPAISWPAVVTAVAIWAGVLAFALAVVEGKP